MNPKLRRCIPTVVHCARTLASWTEAVLWSHGAVVHSIAVGSLESEMQDMWWQVELRVFHHIQVPQCWQPTDVSGESPQPVGPKVQDLRVFASRTQQVCQPGTVGNEVNGVSVRELPHKGINA